MSDPCWLTDEQMDRLRPIVPKCHGRLPVDDRRVLSGIVFFNRNGLRRRDAPREYVSPKTLHNRWSDMGVMAGIMAAAIDASGTIMIDATYLKAHRTTSNSRFIKSGRLIGRTKGRLNTKLHAVADTESTLFQFFLGAGQSIGYAGALAWLDQSAQGRLVAGRQGP